MLQTPFCCGARSRTWETQLMRLVGNHPPRNLWGEYKIRTCVKGFADLRMTTLPTRLICSFIRTRTQSKMSVAFRANPLHYEANLHGLRDSNSHQKFWRLTCCRCTKPAFMFYSMCVSFNLTTLLQNISWNRKTRTFNLSRIRRML